MTVRRLLSDGADTLLRAGIGEADFEAAQLLAFVLHIPAGRLFFLTDVNEIDGEEYRRMLARRVSGEPLQYIIGEWDFYKYTFFCGKGVLIPRPETEELAEACIDFVKKNGVKTVLDLCAGTGCIGLSVALECPFTEVYLEEKYDGAFSYLEKNIAKYGLKNAHAVRGDALKPELSGRRYGVIVSNPPYIESAEMPLLQKEVTFEPATALDGGADGLEFYRAIKKYRAESLLPGGLLAVECGETQTVSVEKIFSPLGETKRLDDIYGNPRFVTAIKHSEVI